MAVARRAKTPVDRECKPNSPLSTTPCIIDSAASQIDELGQLELPSTPDEAFARPQPAEPAAPPSFTGGGREAGEGQGGWGLGDRTAELGLPDEPLAPAVRPQLA